MEPKAPRPVPLSRVRYNDPMLAIITTLIRSGVLGAVLAWSLLQNMRITEREFALTERVVKAIENNTSAVEEIKKLCPMGVAWRMP